MKTPAVTGTAVPRPHEADAIGKALACAFGPARALPPELLRSLGKLDAVR